MQKHLTKRNIFLEFCLMFIRKFVCVNEMLLAFSEKFFAL